MIDLTQSHDVLGAYHSIDFNGIRKKYADPATEYAFNVLDEKVMTGYLMKLACFRHLRDLQRVENEEFEFYYDVNEVDKILKFAAIAPNVDTGKPTKLMDWQKFISKKIVSGQVKVPNHQYIEISTSYPDPSVPFHDEQKMIQQAMEQDFSREADRTLGLIWAQDSLDETFKEDTWIKSNPLLGLPSQHDVLLDGLRDKRDADMLAGTVDDFQNKNLNLWLQEATNSYLKLSDIERAIIPSFDIRGRDVYIGFDYSMFSDNTAIAFVYPYQDENGNQKWHIEQHSFIPWEKAGSIQAKEKQDGIEYRELARKGYCTITSHPQGLINDDQVYNWLLTYVEENNLNVIFFGYDAWGATNAIKQMDINTDYPLETIRQRTSELKDPTKFLQKLFVEGNCSRLNDKIMEKALINAEIYEDKIGIQVDKAKATLKIDVVDAIIDALYQGMYHFEDFGIANDKSKQVDRMTAEQVKAWFENKDSGLLDN